ncbi:MAG: hypothetical protein IKT43_01090 [Clostridia bacterium]|nr:hypothetical protein [Clostridia bacterium]
MENGGKITHGYYKGKTDFFQVFFSVSENKKEFFRFPQIVRKSFVQINKKRRPKRDSKRRFL